MAMSYLMIGRCTDLTSATANKVRCAGPSNMALSVAAAALRTCDASIRHGQVGPFAEQCVLANSRNVADTDTALDLECTAVMKVHSCDRQWPSTDCDTDEQKTACPCQCNRTHP